MNNRQFYNRLRSAVSGRLALILVLACVLTGAGGALSVSAQDQPAQPPAQSQPSQSQPSRNQPAPGQDQSNGKPRQDVPAEAGGPGENVGPYAIPKKNGDTPPPPPPPTAAKK